MHLRARARDQARHHQQSVDPNAIEPRAAIGVYRTAASRSRCTPPARSSPRAAGVVGVRETRAGTQTARRRTDVGGGFGSKIFIYPEETTVAWASRRIGRPVKWTAERSRSFLADAHGRDHVTHAELGSTPRALSACA
jgi:carbon-monoxide dehydrogenase large subunit